MMRLPSAALGLMAWVWVGGLHAASTDPAPPAENRPLASEASHDLERLGDLLLNSGAAIGEGAEPAMKQQSVKCELGKLDGMSVRRLVGCGSATMITFPADPSLKLVRFEIDPGDAKISGGTRAEFQDLYKAHNGEENWYRFSDALPRDFPLPNNRVVLAQWHEYVAGDGNALRPPLAHRLINGQFVVTLWNSTLYAESKGDGDGLTLFREPKFELGIFHEYVYRILWSPDEKGLVTGWRRTKCLLVKATCETGAWEKFIDYKGPIGYSDIGGYYFKYGLYTTHKFDQPMIEYALDYARGPTANSVNAVGALFQN